MIRAIKFLVTPLVVALLLQTANHAVAQEAIPETPAGESLSTLLEAVNGSDDDVRNAFLKNGFEEQDDESIKKRKLQTSQVKTQLGELTFKKAITSSEHRIEALLTSSNGPNIVMTIAVTDDSHRIESIHVEMSGDEDGTSTVDDSPLNNAARSEIIERLAKALSSKYVFPEVAEKMVTALKKSADDSEYDDMNDPREFASALTKQLREICHDKHLKLRAGSPRRAESSSGRRRVDNHGFVKAEILPGGIGYLKFNFFSGDPAAKDTASAAMNFLGNSKALIFDLRDNGGGSPEMIAYLTSYLYEEPTHLNSFYNRPTETTTESWTQKDVPGKKFSPETPVFVLTSSNTFSGAEEFSYNLQNLKRGTIVGETTGGGAHPVMPVVLGSRMHIYMPFARAINPITKTNWEGVGVKPHVEVAPDLALDKAIELAKARFSELAANESNESDKTETSNVDIGELAQSAADLMANESFEEAAEAFGKLTKLAPDQGGAWFNYGYCLHANGDLKKALEVHKKAAEYDQFAGIATYNIACAYSLMKKPDDAFEALNKAIELGFGDANQVEGDSDFDNIRDDDRYVKLMKKLKDN